MEDRSHFIGGSDARVIMGGDEDALIRLWQQKRGEAEPPDLSGNLIVQLGLVTEGLNRFWFERMSGQRVGQCQTRKFHSSIVWMAATLDGVVERTGAVFESKFMLPWSFSEEAAAQKHMAQMQHNMMVAGTKHSVLSIHRRRQMGRDGDRRRPGLPDRFDLRRTGVLARGQRGRAPSLFHAEPPRVRVEAVRVVDMSSSNAWAEYAGLFRSTRQAFLEHERSKTELKSLMPEDAKEAMGHGIRAKRSKAGAVSIDLVEVADAAM